MRAELLNALAAALHAEANVGEEPSVGCGLCRGRCEALLPVIVDFVAGWLEDASCEDVDRQTPVQLWREGFAS